MSSEIAIDIKNLSKCHYIYERPEDRLKKMVFPRLQKAVGIKPSHYGREFWAVKNISFEVKKGETVGIVGRNGSGKSTILQMICGTLNPSGGSALVHGRIAALLELGSGFNPEFTGRENVYLNASILGMEANEIDLKMSEILAFADIGDFIDQPIKNYSSGMVVRLAFAVAINSDPNVLVIDEALSVGDELFQRKCFSRIEEMKLAGATILFVSHSGAAVISLCDRAILIDAGEILAMGEPKKIIGLYQKLLYVSRDRYELIRKQIQSQSLEKLMDVDGAISCVDRHQSLNVGEMEQYFDVSLIPKSTIIYESNGAVIDSPEIYSIHREKVNILVKGGIYTFAYKVRFLKTASNVRFGMMIKTMTGIELGGAVSAVTPMSGISFIEGDRTALIEFNFLCDLNPGVYFLNSGVLGSHDGNDFYLHRIVDVAMFKVMPEGDCLATGFVDFSCQSNIKLIDNFNGN